LPSAHVAESRYSTHFPATRDFAPLVALKPEIDLLRHLILCVAIPVLQNAFELIALAIDHVQTVVGKLAPE
jgi:hypothetical protein